MIPYFTILGKARDHNYVQCTHRWRWFMFRFWHNHQLYRILHFISDISFLKCFGFYISNLFYSFPFWQLIHTMFLHTCVFTVLSIPFCVPCRKIFIFMPKIFCIRTETVLMKCKRFFQISIFMTITRAKKERNEKNVKTFSNTNELWVLLKTNSKIPHANFSMCLYARVKWKTFSLNENV